MILRATYRNATDLAAEPRYLDIERPDYAGCYAVAQAERGADEKLLHVRWDEVPSRPRLQP